MKAEYTRAEIELLEAMASDSMNAQRMQRATARLRDISAGLTAGTIKIVEQPEAAACPKG